MVSVWVWFSGFIKETTLRSALVSGIAIKLFWCRHCVVHNKLFIFRLSFCYSFKSIKILLHIYYILNGWIYLYNVCWLLTVVCSNMYECFQPFVFINVNMYFLTFFVVVDFLSLHLIALPNGVVNVVHLSR